MILVAVAGVIIYDAVLPKAAGSPIPSIWNLGRTNCSQCSPSTILLASNSSNLYVLEQGNISFYSNVSYELSAYNWSTGREVWPSIPIDVGEGVLGSFEQSWGGHAELVSEGNVVSMVTFGTWVEASGQVLGPAPPPGEPISWVIEWNATTGEFLRAQHSGGVLGFPFPSMYVAMDDGWIAVGVYDATNFTVSTFQIGGASSAYGEWNATVSTAGAAPGFFVTADLTMSGGLISIILMGNTNLAAVLNGRSGSLVWEGLLPDLYTVPGNASFSYLPTVVGEFSNVVQTGASFYYIANETGNTVLKSFDFSTNRIATVANLTGLITPINSQLSLLGNQTLVVTDAEAEHYWVFSMMGALLWNLTLPLNQVATTGNTGVYGVDFPPLPLGGSYALVASMWSSDWSNYENNNYPTTTFTIPLSVVDWETGQEIWSSSYTQSLTLGPDPNYPVTYWPLISQGNFAAFAYYPGNGLGWILTIAEFPGVPS